MKFKNFIKDRPIQENFDQLAGYLGPVDAATTALGLGQSVGDRLNTLENRPKFRVVRAGATSLSTGNFIVWDTEELDSHGWFDTTTGQFTPQRAGAYRFSWSIRANVALTVDAFIVGYLAKNAGLTKAGQISYQRGATPAGSVGSAELEANGTTDAFGVIIQHSNGGALAIQASTTFTFFDGEYIG